MKNIQLNTLSLVVGVVSTVSTMSVQAGVQDYNWNGVFRLLDKTGAALSNTSISTKSNNAFDTPISGTLSYDDVAGMASATVASFDWGAQIPEFPFAVTNFDLKAIGDGMGGSGSLMLGNMLFNWNGNNGIPVSMIMDASGFFAGELSPGGANSAVPASDGTYVGEFVPGTVTGPGGYAGYLGLGPVPIATTAWDTSLAAGCAAGVDANFANNTGGGCMGVAISGALPLIFDNTPSGNYVNDYTANVGGNIGGSPMVDGPFTGLSATFDFVSLEIAPSVVPLPSAVWLFGSGIVGLIGAARRKKSKAY